MSQADAPEAPVLEITALDERGAGLARHGERRLEIDAALPGERVRIEPPRRKRRRVQAASVEVLRPSPDRTAARCPHFGVCGGCALQHLRHDAQLAHKQALLLDALGERGLTPGHVRAPLAGRPWGYRRKARLGAKLVPGKGGVLVGFRERHAPYVAVLEGCDVLVEPIGRRIGALRALVGALDARASVPQIEVAAGDEGAALVLRHLEPIGDADRERLAAFAADTGLEILLQPGGPASVATLAGGPPRRLRYALPEFDLVLEFEPMDFVQVNAEVNRKLVAAAVEALALTGGERVLDLFCGIGNFTLPIARHGASVHGIEGSEALVDRARANAARHGIGNARFEALDLYADGPLGASLDGYDRILLDPPRSGAEQVIAALPRAPAARIVYVSCNPQTLARDVAALVGTHGYVLVEAGIVDMFPHTMHVEAIAVLDRA